MIRVAALTAGRHVPSTRFRFRQHFDAMREHGIDVREFVPFIDKYAVLPGWPSRISHKYALPYLALWHACKLTSRLPGVWGSWQNAITWLEREILPGYLTLELGLKRPVVLDVDDAIWLARPFGRRSIARIAKRADVVVAGNLLLADWLSKCNQDVRIVPTAVDVTRYKPKPGGIRDYEKKFVIGWTGTAGNLEYLYRIEMPLMRFMMDHLSAEILVVADKAPSFSQLPVDRVHFVRWSPELEAAVIQKMDVGIMPLPDDEWTRGKCSFKMLQYMACSLPVIVSPVGMNAEVLAMGGLGFGAVSESDWYDSLVRLYDDPVGASQYGCTGRSIVETHFSRDVVTQQLAQIFKGLA